MRGDAKVNLSPIDPLGVIAAKLVPAEAESGFPGAEMSFSILSKLERLNLLITTPKEVNQCPV